MSEGTKWGGLGLEVLLPLCFPPPVLLVCLPFPPSQRKSTASQSKAYQTQPWLPLLLHRCEETEPPVFVCNLSRLVAEIVHLLVSVLVRGRERARERVCVCVCERESFVRGGMRLMMMMVAPRWRES